MKRTLLFALSLFAAAVLARYGIAPFATQLPGDYSSELNFVVDNRFRTSPHEAWETNAFTARRTDQILSNTNGVAIVQGSLDWTNDAGELIFENIGLYGVDRRSRLILPGYGDAERNGQYLFPLHVQPVTYTLWDSQYIGPRTATFDHAENMDGLNIYVFHFGVAGIDETAGYGSLDGVPERYHAHTDGQGTLWVEPLSGIVFDYEEHGVSYFVDAKSGQRLEDFHNWSDRYTPATRAAQLELARQARLRILGLEVWLPAAFLGWGIMLLIVGFLKETKADTQRTRPMKDLAPALTMNDEEPT